MLAKVLATLGANGTPSVYIPLVRSEKISLTHQNHVLLTRVVFIHISLLLREREREREITTK